MFFSILNFIYSTPLIVLAIDTKNICSDRCEYCCRDKKCRSKEICDGSLQPLLISGFSSKYLLKK